MSYIFDLDGALIKAAKRGHKNVVFNLICRGANPRASNELPLRQAALRGHSEVAKILQRYGASVSAAIVYAAYIGKSDEVSALFEIMPDDPVVKTLRAASRRPQRKHSP